MNVSDCGKTFYICVWIIQWLLKTACTRRPIRWRSASGGFLFFCDQLFLFVNNKCGGSVNTIMIWLDLLVSKCLYSSAINLQLTIYKITIYWKLEEEIKIYESNTPFFYIRILKVRAQIRLKWLLFLYFLSPAQPWGFLKSLFLIFCHQPSIRILKNLDSKFWFL